MRSRSTILLPLLVLVSIGLGSCNNPPIQDICVSKIPEFDHQALLAQNELRQSRTIASAEPQLAWEDWAETRLREAQSYMDAIDLDNHPSMSRRRLSRELTEVANELVLFYGYAASGETVQMTQSLGRVRTHVARVRAIACARE